jgi:hypothetical protein
VGVDLIQIRIGAIGIRNEACDIAGPSLPLDGREYTTSTQCKPLDTRNGSGIYDEQRLESRWSRNVVVRIVGFSVVVSKHVEVAAGVSVMVS